MQRYITNHFPGDSKESSGNHKTIEAGISFEVLFKCRKWRFEIEKV